MATVTLLRSVLPAGEVWVGKLLIDAVASAIVGHLDSPPISLITALVAIQLGLLAAGSLLRTLSNIFQQLLQERVSQRIQLDVMAQADRLDLAAFEDSSFYDRLQMVQREAAFRPVQMVSELFGLVRVTISFGSMVVLLAGLSPLVALVTLLTPIPSFIASTRFGWQGFQLMRRQSPLRRMMGYLTTVQTTDTYHKELQIYGLGPYFLEKFRLLSSRYYLEMRGLLVRRYLVGFAWGSLGLLATSATYLFVALQAVAGRLTLGDLGLFTRAAAAVQDDFQSILGGFSSLYEHGLYLATLFDLLAQEPAIVAPQNPAPVRRPFQEGIEFRDVTFTYPGRTKPALDRLSFTIRPGEAIAVVGRNGAGKTTLVKLLARLYDPQRGQILVDGRDVREYDPAQLRADIGAIFQDYATYQLTVRENIGFGRLENLDQAAAIEEAAARGGAADLITKLPSGYETVLGKWFEGGHQLSGGEWQKIALARAFMRDAQILVLDEPTASLDAAAEYELFQRIRELTRGKTTIFISHRFSTVRAADRILVIEHGRLVEQGSHADLVELGGRYADLFEKQASSYR